MAQIAFDVPRGANPKEVYEKQTMLAKMRRNTALKAVHNDERLLEWINKHHNEIEVPGEPTHPYNLRSKNKKP